MAVYKQDRIITRMIGERIYHYRMKYDVSKQSLADAIGVQNNVISYIEREGRSISFFRLYQIAEALGITTAKLIPSDLEIKEVLDKL